MAEDERIKTKNDNNTSVGKKKEEEKRSSINQWELLYGPLHKCTEYKEEKKYARIILTKPSLKRTEHIFIVQQVG